MRLVRGTACLLILFLLIIFVGRASGQPPSPVGSLSLLPEDARPLSPETIPSEDTRPSSPETIPPEVSRPLLPEDPRPFSPEAIPPEVSRPLTRQGHPFPQRWKAGEQVSREAVEAFGLANCFTSEPLDDTIFSRINGKSYQPGRSLPKEDLRYLKILHYDGKQEIRLGELICHKRVSRDLLEIFRVLFDARYPIEKMILIDEYGADDECSMRDNNTSCFNFRLVPGTKKLSAHALGLAVDINPRYNPYVKVVGGQPIHKPRNAGAYIDRSADFPYKIDREDRCYKEFRKRGFSWGGNWKSLKDYQHFEKASQESPGR